MQACKVKVPGIGLLPQDALLCTKMVATGYSAATIKQAEAPIELQRPSQEAREGASQSLPQQQAPGWKLPSPSSIAAQQHGGLTLLFYEP